MCFFSVHVGDVSNQALLPDSTPFPPLFFSYRQRGCLYVSVCAPTSLRVFVCVCVLKLAPHLMSHLSCPSEWFSAAHLIWGGFSLISVWFTEFHFVHNVANEYRCRFSHQCMNLNNVGFSPPFFLLYLVFSFRFHILTLISHVLFYLPPFPSHKCEPVEWLFARPKSMNVLWLIGRLVVFNYICERIRKTKNAKCVACVWSLYDEIMSVCSF